MCAVITKNNPIPKRIFDASKQGLVARAFDREHFRLTRVHAADAVLVFRRTAQYQSLTAVERLPTGLHLRETNRASLFVAQLQRALANRDVLLEGVRPTSAERRADIGVARR